MRYKKVPLQSNKDLIVIEIILLRSVKQSKTVLSERNPYYGVKCADNRFFSAHAK